MPPRFAPTSGWPGGDRRRSERPRSLGAVAARRGARAMSSRQLHSPATTAGRRRATRLFGSQFGSLSSRATSFADIREGHRTLMRQGIVRLRTSTNLDRADWQCGGAARRGRVSRLFVVRLFCHERFSVRLYAMASLTRTCVMRWRTLCWWRRSVRIRPGGSSLARTTPAICSIWSFSTDRRGRPSARELTKRAARPEEATSDRRRWA